ncbi:hypothetical protein HBH70_093150 [Parastagonospora nodorum]|uniref:Uncharacterized protein n=1 Tax=Phaeosphaeria nodorum (strain SN15 / ATCC MYA-4574 / FGSC 10173) TaxID=321614 RepID=Q0UC79_PHANO|nr:hypothetical protein SNOG_10635 [Parastagonospora nodorum SN15]KAH4067668.1 hypothetical protein HBH50_130200 [Parastagonospora nodorum]EAT82029.1 hypothetical protein SNOG_10635 [Parastagonospora nodorum SN15]KAH4086768.1 hypothetical protein HBH48_139620 [Parastagonospora nodorum]KAH4137779.1 hypothetical protein HBH45_120030 [Parastagonospora nodorum]KAH4171959.1 hypothetical protein HBH44_028930 [Parastagonospora nodorum]
MWNKSDVLQLLQLLTMVMLAMIHAGWCLLIHQVNMRRYAKWHEPAQVEDSPMPMKPIEEGIVIKELDMSV